MYKDFSCTYLGFDIMFGEDIEKAIENLSGTSVANINPNRAQRASIKIGTIPGNSDLSEWCWPTEAADPNQWDLRRWTIKKLKEELMSRNISYEEKMDRDKLVELLQEYLCKETLTKPLDDNSIVEEMELDSNLIQQFPLNTGWAFKHKHKYGRKGGGKQLLLDVVEMLKRFFIAGQEDPSNRYSSKDMLAALEEMVKNGELTKEEIPTEKSIDSWISRYSRMSKQMIAKKMIDNDIDSE
ncbi:hypothetical protein F8M41_005213 [Gigaspora margarita]|uniref:Uncharacterized protein n=1 Tax=Gigaspora margarita TaxID=4874 RepID=A0A8H3X8F6_GIGMA|nr:hypothetical protein F8M41_005213 [Gigaspora margarita]